MSSNFQAILESKRLHRQHLAALPIAEKLRMLDSLRERALLLRPASSAVLHEESVPYLPDKSSKP